MMLQVILLLSPVLLFQDSSALQQQMAERPLEAFRLLRDAANGLPPARVRELLVEAARIQEQHLARLNEDQVQELADVHTVSLRNSTKAEQIRRKWLQLRRESLGAADAMGRVQLAEIMLRWFDDRQTATILAIEAVKIRSDLPGAIRLLEERLGYRKSDSGWQPREAIPVADRLRNLPRLRTGMPPGEVRNLLGLPDRVARQILDGRYLEQWTYIDPPSTWVEFNCPKGKDPYLVTVQYPGKGRN